jgi:dTDP-4-amino-4,6-dideoxygalactose transaminase
MRKLPPVGTKLRWPDLLATLRADAQSEERFAALLAELIPHERAFFFGSGRAALAALLVATRRLRAGDRVIVPAYTCWSVPAAIVRAGLRVLPVDIKPGQLDYDFDKLGEMSWRDVVAIVSPGLFGLPSDLERLAGMAEAHHAVMIDDAAQCLGARTGGRPAGSFGSAGLLSFGRGKNITTLGGGAALVHDPDLAAALADTADAFRGDPAPTGFQLAAKGGAMSLALSPELYGLAEQFPGVSVGRTVFEPNFETAAFGPGRAAIGEQLLPRLPEINKRRGTLVQWLDHFLQQKHGVVLPTVRQGANAAWLRRPILTQEIGKRDALLAAIRAAGIGATAMYPAPVAAIANLDPDLDLRAAPFPGAQRVASSLIALPLTEGATKDDLERLSAAVGEVMGRKVGERWA